MTALVRSIRSANWNVPHGIHGLTRRALLVAVMVAVISLVPQGWSLAIDAMSEAYLAVTVFVAGTLALVTYAERALKIDLGVWLDQHAHLQVPVATLLGAFPGCGSAIIAVTQFTRGYLSFGAVVATLIATMGDAMFLLLAREPQTAVLVIGVSMVAAVVSGYAIDRIHGPDFLRPKQRKKNINTSGCGLAMSAQNSKRGDALWLLLIVPGAVIGVLAAFQTEADAFFAPILGFDVAVWLGAAGAILALGMWAAAGESRLTCSKTDGACDARRSAPMQRVIDTTNFVTSWVIFAFVGYELLVAAAGVELGQVFAVWAPIVPVIAVLIGFIPGCGPPIVVTTMYLSGTLPLSAQLGNAIANDGDALFPAIAIAPKAAIVATLYSAVPALIVAYGWLAFVEGGLS